MKQGLLKKFLGGHRLEEIDLVYFPLRVAGVIATILWAYLHPLGHLSRLIIISTIAFFALYSFPFYFFLISREDFKKLYLLLMVPDMVIITVLVKYSGEGLSSPFIVGYYLIAALHGFYYGLGPAIIAASIASAAGLGGNLNELTSPPGIHFADNISQFGFLWALAISSGLFGSKMGFDKRKIESLNELSNKQLSKLSALYEIEKAITTSIELDQVMRLFLFISTKVLDADAGAILTVDKERKYLEFRSALGGKADALKGLKPRYGKGKSICGCVAETGEPLIVNDVESDPNYGGEIDKITGYKTRNLLCVPLITSSGTKGVIEIINKKGFEDFNSDDLEFMNSIASTASSAIEKAFLFEETKQHVDELDILLNIVNAIGLRSKLDEIFKIVLDYVKKLFPGESGVIYLIESGTGEIMPVQSFGAQGRGALKHQVPNKLMDCFAISDGHPLFISSELASGHSCRIFLDNRTKSFICTPIKAGLSTFGVLHIASKSEDVFSPHHVRLAKGIGEQLAMAIQRAYLFDQINEMAMTDQLTGLLNFREFQNRLDEEFKRVERYQRPLSLMMIDIDFFKNYNDTFGHPKGDLVLKRIAMILKEGVRETDLVFRYGGEELSVILPETDKEQARVIAERLRQMVEESYFDGEEKQPNGKLTISIGVASTPFDAVNKEGLIEKSDVALYEAKRQGRNVVKTYAPPPKKVVPREDSPGATPSA